MRASVYTTDLSKKKQYCTKARKVTKSWAQYNMFFYISLIAFALDLLICLRAILMGSRSYSIGILSAVFLSLNILFFNKQRNSDTTDMFNRRVDETVMYLSNGDLLYAYRPILQTARDLPIVVLSMKNSDMQQIYKSDHPDMMIFKGKFSRYESHTNTVDALIGAAAENNNEKCNGSILIPSYITPNESLTRLMKTVINYSQIWDSSHKV